MPENQQNRPSKGKPFYTLLGGLSAGLFVVFIAFATGDMSGVIKLGVVDFLLGAVGGYTFASVEFLPPRRGTKNAVRNYIGGNNPPEVP